MNKVLESAEQLRGILQMPEFKGALTEAVSETINEEHEAAFVVYKKSVAAFEVSKVITGTDDTVSSSVVEAMESRYESVDVKELVFPQYPESDIVRMRSDIALMLHSHPRPPFKDSGSKEFLRPSHPDLEINEEAEVTSPGHVGAIVVIENNLSVASLLLYRRVNPARPAMYYRLLHEEYAAKTMLEEMRDSGFAHVEIDYNVSKGSYERNFGRKLLELF